MENTPQEFRFHEEIDLLRQIVDALRHAQDTILTRPWLAPMLARVMPENGITERTFQEFTAQGIKGLCDQVLAAQDDAESE